MEAEVNNIKRQFFNAVGFGLLFFFIYATYGVSFWYGINMVFDEDFSYQPGQMTTVRNVCFLVQETAINNYFHVFAGILQRHVGIHVFRNVSSVPRNVCSRQSSGLATTIPVFIHLRRIYCD